MRGLSVWPIVAAFAVWLLVVLTNRPQEDVFLDKVCIHQSDPEKKLRSIDGLGGFLKKSNKVLVLWDPSYFTRLWCALEMAATLHILSSNLVFYPIARGATAFWITITHGV